MFTVLKIVLKIIVAIVLIIFIFKLFGFIFNNTLFIKRSLIGDTLETNTNTLSKQSYTSPSVKINSAIITVEVVRDDISMQKGLSGRLTLGENSGMLFLFPTTSKSYRFWMPDMHFPIDLFWINSDKVIVGIEKNISPNFDPANPHYYNPTVPIQFVLETNAGFAQKNNIKIGDTVVFDNIT